MTSDRGARQYRGVSRTSFQWFRTRCQHLALPCALCGEPVDYALTYPNPMSFSLDHIKPASVRPDLVEDPMNWQPAHLLCNQSRGKSVMITERVTSRRW